MPSGWRGATTVIESALLVFARAPRPGRVKTRLVPVLGARRAVDLHLALARRLFAEASASRFDRVELWVDALEPALPAPLAWPRHLQSGADLGVRMARALDNALTRVRCAVLVGTDCPTLERRDLDAALERLLRGDDAVIAPVLDGGYALIGFRRPPPAVLFRDMPWGSPRVAALTRARLRAAGFGWSELVYGFDVDRPEDLARLRRVHCDG